MILTRPCPMTCLIYSKDENRSAREKPNRRHEVPARYKRLSLGRGCRTQAQPHGARRADVIIVGVVFLGRGVMGSRRQVRALSSAASESTFGIHSLRDGLMGHAHA